MRGPEVYFCSTLVLTASEDTPSCRTRVRRCSRQLSFRLVLGSPVLTGHFPVRHGLLREQMVVGPDRPDRLDRGARKAWPWAASARWFGYRSWHCRRMQPGCAGPLLFHLMERSEERRVGKEWSSRWGAEA